MKLTLSNTGFIFDNIDDLKNHSVSLKIAFIIGASPAMIGDDPSKEQIAEELSKIKFTTGEKMASIADILVLKVLTLNKQRINEYFNKIYKGKLVGYHIINFTLDITKYGKTGAVIKDGRIESVALLSMKNPHPVVFSRDFIGYFFEIAVEGKIDLVMEDKSVAKSKLIFTRIPVLAFKSENATVNEASLEISKTVLERLTRRKHEVIIG